MSTRAERWRDLQQRAAALAPRVRLDGGEAHHSGRGVWAVTIRGVDLFPYVERPRVSVGGRLVHDLRFSVDGRTLTGIIEAAPEHRLIVVDYGYTRGVAEGSW